LVASISNQARLPRDIVNALRAKAPGFHSRNTSRFCRSRFGLGDDLNYVAAPRSRCEAAPLFRSQDLLWILQHPLPATV